MDFREMRRKDKLVDSNEELVKILARNEAGVLSLLGDGDYCYGVSLNYAYDDGKIYAHCAGEGHKLDAIKKHDKVCFTVIDSCNVLPGDLNTEFCSVIAFGKARKVEDHDEKRHAARVIMEKFAPEYMDLGMKETEDKIKFLGVIELEVEHMTGKEFRK